jgi:hypothetical protein
MRSDFRQSYIVARLSAETSDDDVLAFLRKAFEDTLIHPRFASAVEKVHAPCN